VTSVDVSTSNGVTRLLLNGQERRNSIDVKCYRDLVEALRAAAADPETEVIAIAGAGNDFSVGEDLGDGGEPVAWSGEFDGFIPDVWHHPKLIVAIVRGAAWGVASELALMADLTYADESATFGHPLARHGLVRPSIWPWLVGPKVAKEYLATGRLMSADAAEKHGLINRVFSPSELDQEADQVLAELVAMPRGTPGALKRRVGWAFRDVSRVLHDDLRYNVDLEWLRDSRDVDFGFYESVAESGIHGAITERDSDFNA
jgi:enoyl-CoA hydratase/carnithine racemase